MIENRKLAWAGCQNVRDLGGLRASRGRKTRWGAAVRSDDPSKLAAAGWACLVAHGIRTIVSLQTVGIPENDLAALPPPSGIATVAVAIEDINDTEFVQKWVDSGLWCTPLYYRDALQRWPERHAAAMTAIARAAPGGVLFHCSRGNDRTGIIAMLLLALVGVEPGLIAEDYELSPDPDRDELLKIRHTSSRAVILAALAGLDVESYLLAGRLARSDLAALRQRLLEPL
jgi:protein-tyrosine phosphatase